MFAHIKLENPNDCFLKLKERRESGVYFCRINSCNREILRFIGDYYEAARLSGVVIEGRIPNPSEANLAYYAEIMGMDFRMDVVFFTESLKKWLPRMHAFQRENIALSVYDTLDALRKTGKNENMLKNAYIKFMCWLYYKFERIANRLGENEAPKILYEGEVGKYELMLLEILSKAGCDIVLLQYKGDAAYRKLDVESACSDELKVKGGEAFPEYFNLKWLRGRQQEQMQKERLYGSTPQLFNCTNAWISGNWLSDIQVPAANRGSDPKLFYNCFIRINGVEDKLSYSSGLHRFLLEMKNSGRRTAVAEGGIPKPSTDEIAAVRRETYSRNDQMLAGLAVNIQYGANGELQKLMRKAFIDVMAEEAERPGMNLGKLTGRAVYLICWLKRYQKQLFVNWKMPEISCFIYFGGCKSGSDALFLKMLAKLPSDVLLLKPDRNEACCLDDGVLYEINYEESLALEHFPAENVQMRVGTAAYHAERELDSLMYQDSGLYRNKQHAKANAVLLQTSYEEIAVLWDQELKYRPNFSTIEKEAEIPVLFAKASGIKDGDVSQYWPRIKSLMTRDAIIVKNAPYIHPLEQNPIKAHAAGFLKNGRLMREKIKQHSCYPYAFLREEMQEHILDKLQIMLDQKLIKGMFENGTEYTAVAVALNLKKEITRLLQKFDFTGKNPKFLYIHTTERTLPLEDAVLAVFLSLAGFDVLFFVPTGYQSIECYLNKKMMEEHQIGEYVYDLQIPDFNLVDTNTRPSWREKIFKRGR